MNAFVNDLRYAHITGVAVEVHLVTGEKLLKGVHDVREDEGFVSLFDPQHLGDGTTTRKLALDMIGSITVTDVRWRRE